MINARCCTMRCQIAAIVAIYILSFVGVTSAQPTLRADTNCYYASNIRDCTTDVNAIIRYSDQSLDRIEDLESCLDEIRQNAQHMSSITSSSLGENRVQKLQTAGKQQQAVVTQCLELLDAAERALPDRQDNAIHDLKLGKRASSRCSSRNRQALETLITKLRKIDDRTESSAEFLADAEAHLENVDTILEELFQQIAQQQSQETQAIAKQQAKVVQVAKQNQAVEQFNYLTHNTSTAPRSVSCDDMLSVAKTLGYTRHLIADFQSRVGQIRSDEYCLEDALKTADEVANIRVLSQSTGYDWSSGMTREAAQSYVRTQLREQTECRLRYTSFSDFLTNEHSALIRVAYKAQVSGQCSAYNTKALETAVENLSKLQTDAYQYTSYPQQHATELDSIKADLQKILKNFQAP